MQYVLLFNETAGDSAREHEPADEGRYWGAWNAYMGALAQAGVMGGGNGLQPPATATTLRLRDGQRLVQDGPFAETKEMLGGYIVLNVPDLDAALDWAAKAPCAGSGSVEIRPVLDNQPGD